MNNEQYVPDGEPGVHASGFVDYAIFMAILSPQNCPREVRSRCGSDENGNLHFAATSATLEQIAEESVGYVHVFLRSDFIQRNYSEWVSYNPVEPIDIIEVKRTDFQREISIIIENVDFGS